MPDYVPRAVASGRRIEARRTGETAEMEALSVKRADLAESVAENLHNFRQLQAADFPGSLKVEVVKDVDWTIIAKLAELMKFDVEFDANERYKRHAIVRKLMRGYMLPVSPGSAEVWEPSSLFRSQDIRDVALAEDGNMYLIDDNKMGTRGALVVRSSNYGHPMASVESPEHLSIGLAFSLAELTKKAIEGQDGGIYVPFDPAAPQPTAEAA